MIVFSYISTKGGVGKTTLAANTGGILADMGLRVLLIDADIRPMLTKYFPILQQGQDGFFDILTRGSVTPLAISKTSVPGLDIVFSNIDIADVMGWLSGRIDRDIRLRSSLRCPFVEENYDVVILDSQGAQGVLQEASALAADEIVSPVVPEVLSVREFRDGTIELYSRLHQSRVTPGPLRAVINRMARTKDSKEMVLAMRTDQRSVGISGRVNVLNTVIPAAKAYTEAATKQIPVHQHEYKKRDGISANEALHQLVWELMPTMTGMYAKTRWETNGSEVTHG